MADYSSICAGKQIFHRFRDFRGIALAFILRALMIYMSTTVQKKKTKLKDEIYSYFFKRYIYIFIAYENMSQDSSCLFNF